MEVFIMTYWITLILSLIILLPLAFYLWKKKIKDGNRKKEACPFCTALLFAFLCATVILSVDIPNAINGGETMYVNELPTYVYFGQLSHIVTDNDELRRLKCFNWNEYEKYGNYRIRYTKLTKFVLDIEKLD